MVRARAAAVLAGLLVLAAAPARAGVADLAWLTGGWVSDQKGRLVEEQWSPPQGETMLGYGWTVKDGRVAEYEFFRIAPDEHRTPTYYALVNGRPPLGFALTASDAQSATFDNPAHDYPQRIVYRRTADTLTATISLIGGAKPQTWTYRRK